MADNDLRNRFLDSSSITASLTHSAWLQKKRKKTSVRVRKCKPCNDLRTRMLVATISITRLK